MRLVEHTVASLFTGCHFASEPDNIQLLLRAQETGVFGTWARVYILQPGNIQKVFELARLHAQLALLEDGDST